jgi:hypothetical protein
LQVYAPFTRTTPKKYLYYFYFVTLIYINEQSRTGNGGIWQDRWRQGTPPSSILLKTRMEIFTACLARRLRFSRVVHAAILCNKVELLFLYYVAKGAFKTA